MFAGRTAMQSEDHFMLQGPQAAEVPHSVCWLSHSQQYDAMKRLLLLPLLLLLAHLAGKTCPQRCSEFPHHNKARSPNPILRAAHTGINQQQLHKPYLCVFHTHGGAVVACGAVHCTPTIEWLRGHAAQYRGLPACLARAETGVLRAGWLRHLLAGMAISRRVTAPRTGWACGWGLYWHWCGWQSP